jgi:hypothetical protein
MRSEPHNSDSILFLGVPPYGLVYRWRTNVSETFVGSIVREVTLKAEQEVLQPYRYLIYQPPQRQMPEYSRYDLRSFVRFIYKKYKIRDFKLSPRSK